MKNKKKKILIILIIALIMLGMAFIYIRFFFVTDVFYAPFSKKESGVSYSVNVTYHPFVEKIGNANGRVLIKDPLNISFFSKGFFRFKNILKSIPSLGRTVYYADESWGIFYTHYDKKNKWYEVVWIKEAPWTNPGIMN